MENCIFCKIAAGTIPSTVVYEDEKILAFRDINPEAPTHILVIPKRHISSTNALEPSDEALIGYIFTAAKNIAKAEGIDESGYRIVNNCGRDGGQTVQHLHFHILGGRSLSWPPG